MSALSLRVRTERKLGPHHVRRMSKLWNFFSLRIQPPSSHQHCDVSKVRLDMDFDDSSRTLSAGSVLSEETLVMEDDDLSDEQIDFLLQRASLRMKSKSGALATSDDLAVKLPQPNGAKGLPAPYTSVENGVAKLAESKMMNEEQRQTAEKPKKIEDPVAAAKKGKKERESASPNLSCICALLHMMKLYPNFSSTRTIGSILDVDPHR